MQLHTVHNNHALLLHTHHIMVYIILIQNALIYKIHTFAGLYYELMESGVCSQCKKSLIPPGEESISTSEVRQKGLDQLLSYYVCAFFVF